MAINWGDVIKTALAIVGGSAGLLAVIAWLIKAVISQALVLQTETLKTKLKAEADIEIEKLRNALQMAAVEHQVRFASLHEKRAEVIAELYGRALDAYQDGQKFVLADAYTDDHTKQQEASLSTNQKLLDFYFFVEKNRIYLPEQTCSLLNTFVDIMRKHVIRVGVYGSVGSFPTPEVLEQRHKAFEDAYSAFQKDIPAVTKALEDDFRGMLGVEKSPLPGSSPT